VGRLRKAPLFASAARASLSKWDPSSNSTVSSAPLPGNWKRTETVFTGIRDKRPLQYTVDENIRAVRHYVLILEEGWGPPERNFKHDYAVARECLDDPAQPMKSITVLTKGVIEDTGFPAADATYFKRGEFDACIVGLLNGWLQELCLGKGDKS
jgi:hypothetical protein